MERCLACEAVVNKGVTLGPPTVVNALLWFCWPESGMAAYRALQSEVRAQACHAFNPAYHGLASEARSTDPCNRRLPRRLSDKDRAIVEPIFLCAPTLLSPRRWGLKGGRCPGGIFPG